MTTRRLEVGSGNDAVRTARLWVRDVLREAGITDVELAELATSELVANAVQHGSAPRSVVVRSAGQRARVEVRDGSPELPPPAGSTGRPWSGLAIVDAFIERWGAERVGAGTCVWFLVDGHVDAGSGRPAPR